MPYVPSKRLNFNAILTDMAKRAHKTTMREAQSFAERSRKGFVQRIEDQDFESFRNNPLSPSWLAKKLRAGADERVHIATGTYTGNIEVMLHRVSSFVKLIGVGFDTETTAVTLKGEPTELPLYRLADILENGSAENNLPPRPHWGPYSVEVKREASIVRSKIVSQVVKETRRAVLASR